MFPGCPSVLYSDVCPKYRPDFLFTRLDSCITIMDFHQTWYFGPPPGFDELISSDGEIRSMTRVKGQ